MKQPAVYIVANKRNGTLYTGVTSNLPQRIWQHRNGLVQGFTSRYGCKLLVWHEHYELMTDAIAREKQIKAGSRAKKLALIEAVKSDVARSLRRPRVASSVIAREAKQSRVVGRPLDCFGAMLLAMTATL